MIAALLVAALVLLAGLPALHNDFVDLDDQTYVVNKPVSSGLTTDGLTFAFTSLSPYWQPVTWLSHELDAELFGSAPAGHHFTSVLLHAITAGLLCLTLMALGADPWLAGAAALLWGLHPLRVESFAWVTERKDVLCALFFVAAVGAYLRYQKHPGRARYALWLLCGALALMSKPTAVTLPVVLLLLDLWPGKRKAPLWRLVVEKIPLAAMAAAVIVATVVGQQRDGATSLVPNLSVGTRLASAAVSYARYLGKMLWPLNLACHYPYERHLPLPWVLLSAALLIGATVGAAAQWRRRPWLAVGWAWFVVTLLPNAGLVQSGRQAMADRFTHIPMIGIAIGVAWAVSEWAGPQRTPRRAAAVAAAALLVALAFLTIRQIGYWHDSATLFEHAIAVNDSDYMQANLATTLMGQRRDAEAEPHLRAAIRLAPSESGYHQDLAVLLSRTRRLDEAARESQKAVALAPHTALLVEFAGMVALRRGRYDEALAALGKAVNLGSDPARIAAVLNDNGASLAAHGRPRDGEPLVRQAVQLAPALVQARRNLLLILMDERRAEEARESLRLAIEATGDRPEYSDLDRQLNGPAQ
jgi:Flp pilus assembly protein TadD